MGRRVGALTLDVLDDLPRRCRSCVFWELDPVAARQATERGDPAFDKEAWVSATLLEWGSCGRIAYVDDRPAGYVLYAPPALVPRSASFATSPVSADAVLMTAVRVLPEFAGGGIARMLVQSAVKDLTRRGVRALEAFGHLDGPASSDPASNDPASNDPASNDPASSGPASSGPASNDPASRGPVGDGLTGACLIPADFLLAVGFATIRPHPRHPRLRLDLRTALSWREDVEAALERLLGTVRAPVLTR